MNQPCLTLFLAAVSITLAPFPATHAADNPRLAEVRARVEPALREKLAKSGIPYGAPTFIRIFKEEKTLELWIQPEPGARYKRFHRYPIATWGRGTIGPKLREGDGQAPEGFYQVSASAMNPNSSFHLSFNLGFPNRYDRHHRRTGTHLMVHGDQVSVGCYAMTDPQIEEIYLLVDAAHRSGQRHVPVHCFPFNITQQKLATPGIRNSPWLPFWRNLKTGYDHFERVGSPPSTSLDPRTGSYRFSTPSTRPRG